MTTTEKQGMEIDEIMKVLAHRYPFLLVDRILEMDDKRVVGISKLARLVDVYAKRLQIQEKMTAQIANTLDEVLQPKGVAVVIEAARSLAPAERVLYGGSTLRRWARTFVKSRDRKTLGSALVRGIAAGVRTSPRPTEEVLAGVGLKVPAGDQD